MANSENVRSTPSPTPTTSPSPAPAWTQYTNQGALGINTNTSTSSSTTTTSSQPDWYQYTTQSALLNPSNETPSSSGNSLLTNHWTDYTIQAKLLSDAQSTEQGATVSSAVEAASNPRSQISARMAGVGEIIRRVAQALLQDPVYAIGLRFEVNSLVINTSSTDTNQNIMMSFEIQKNGSGYANSFTIRIAYAPNVDDGEFDINRIDSALEGAVSRTNGQAFCSRYCLLSYGYASINGTSMMSNTYTGMIMDYTCEINEGMLLYTITGYSGLTFWKENKDFLKIPSSIKKPTLAVRYIVENYLNAGSLADRPYEIHFDPETEGSDAEIAEEEFPASIDKNPASAMTDLLNLAVHESQKEALENNTLRDDEMITYEWFVSDQKIPGNSNNSGVIYVVKHVPELDEKVAADANIVFNWMNPSKGDALSQIVLDFKPRFEGKVRLGLIAEKVNPEPVEETGTEEVDPNFVGPPAPSQKPPTDADYFNGSFFINDEGEAVAAPYSRSPQTGGTLSQVTANMKMEKSSWVHEAQYPYKATLNTVGIPIDIPITGRIQVVPMIYGQKHHSAGIYEVLSTTDRIDSSGAFTTEWELIKLVQVKDEANTENQGISESVDGTTEESSSWFPDWYTQASHSPGWWRDPIRAAAHPELYNKDTNSEPTPGFVNTGNASDWLPTNPILRETYKNIPKESE